jgi:hypothetical protein
MLWKERENETEGRDRLKTQSSVGVKMIWRLNTFHLKPRGFNSLHFFLASVYEFSAGNWPQEESMCALLLCKAHSVTHFMISMTVIALTLITLSYSLYFITILLETKIFAIQEINVNQNYV